jgi:hypothetical protein
MSAPMMTASIAVEPSVMAAATYVRATVIVCDAGVASPTIATISALLTSISTEHNGTANADRTNPTTSLGASSFSPYRSSSETDDIDMVPGRDHRQHVRRADYEAAAVRDHLYLRQNSDVDRGEHIRGQQVHQTGQPLRDLIAQPGDQTVHQRTDHGSAAEDALQDLQNDRASTEIAYPTRRS